MAQVLECLIDITSPCLTCFEHWKFNLCRLYLQVITLSVITTSFGTEIDIHFWRGNRSLCTSNLKWAQQTHPSPQCYTIWRRTLHLLFATLHKSNHLLQAHHLHHWLPHSRSHQKWPTLIDPSTLLLYSRKPGIPLSYSILFHLHPKIQVQLHINWHYHTITTLLQCPYNSHPLAPLCSHNTLLLQTSALNLLTCMSTTLIKEPYPHILSKHSIPRAGSLQPPQVTTQPLPPSPKWVAKSSTPS